MNRNLKNLWIKSDREILELLEKCESCESEEFKYAYAVLQLKHLAALAEKLGSIEDKLNDQIQLLDRIATATELDAMDVMRD
ncbi:MAG: hypothetical protein Q7O12_14300 [Deltaproteobacteria bacterium]|nr:hypothetical protein [Deltaproteobacteria bacterium]